MVVVVVVVVVIMMVIIIVMVMVVMMVVVVLVGVPIALIKPPDQKQHGRKGFISSYSSQIIT